LEQSLDDHIKQREEAIEDFEDIISDIAVQMLDAIKQVHSTGRIHRDIKPENFMVHQGRVYVTDFGTIAKFLDEEGKFCIAERGHGFIGTCKFASINSHDLKG
jgi:casein kinase 1